MRLHLTSARAFRSAALSGATIISAVHPLPRRRQVRRSVRRIELVTRGTAIVRLCAAVATSVIASVFASLYSHVSGLTLSKYMQLPGITEISVLLVPYGYGVPVVVLYLGLMLLKRQKESGSAFECVIAGAWGFSVFWTLLTLFAWQLPRIPGG